MRGERIVIHGAGVIGLSLALELHRRGVPVELVDEPRTGIASLAAAGMLAAEDPENPSNLRPLSLLSASLYPEFLDRVRDLSGIEVPFETTHALQQTDANVGERLSAAQARAMVPGLANADGFVLLAECSVDPRRLHAALHRAVESAGIPCTTSDANAVTVDCTGAWSATMPHAVRPVKGQMLRVALAPGTLTNVLRTPEIYAVPRLDGTVIIGATVEEAGFSTGTEEAALDRLLGSIGKYLPALQQARRIESWAGIRPGTRDDLPLLGAVSRNRFVATGHFRNGILLAPATALVVADLLLGVTPPVDPAPFAPKRFQP